MTIADNEVRIVKLEMSVDGMRERHEQHMTECITARKETRSSIDGLRRDTFCGIDKLREDVVAKLDTTNNCMTDMRIAVAKSSVVIGGIVVVASALMSAVFRWILP